MTKKPLTPDELEPRLQPSDDFGGLDDWDLIDEPPPSPEELAQAKEMAGWMDALLHDSPVPTLSEADRETPDFALPKEEAEELAAMGMLLRHSHKSPSLPDDSKLRLENELLAMVPKLVPVKQEEPKTSWWASLLDNLQLVLQRPVMAAMAVAVLCVGSWGVWQSQQPSQVNPSLSVTSGLRGQSLFGGTLSKTSTQNPFSQTRSASERLERVTQQLGQWQRNRWGQKMRLKRYGNL